MTEAVGLAAAAFPNAWLCLFDTDPAMLEAGRRHLRKVGPVYGFFGLVNAGAVAGGAWFGLFGWPQRTAALLDRMRQT